MKIIPGRLGGPAVVWLLAAVQLGCGDAHLRKGRAAFNRGDFEHAAQALLAAAQNNPRDAARFRELGVAYFHLRDFERALAALERARRLQPADGRTLFFIGYVHEQQGRYAEALAAYGAYRPRPLFDPLGRQVQARMSRLALQLAEQEIQKALQEEQSRTLTRPAANTVAVLYFRNVSERAEWNPLLKGLAAMLTTDLGKVNKLRLVERTKLEVLLHEISATPAQLYDGFTAPRAGRILGAERVVIGGATALGTSSLQLDAGIIQSATSELVAKTVRVSGRLSDILQLEKQLAFALIQQLGIKLSVSERDAIQKLPTESTLAFVAFCRGLDFADSLKIPQAQAAFSEALRLDPGFQAARQQLEALTTPMAGETELLTLAQLDPAEALQQRHLEATTATLQEPPVFVAPLIPPASSGRIVVSGKIPN
ncbi:MAG: tetratricopeptide repeat protein [candidate division KSB1 bacterium]|nr:tetratricopeptide repeat protein [candidate division KSB1 bacterium]MDZ7273444.1 tetratricopeptide repeat protein [candidate division KSB1 bacterium]MDZ7286964.1 tetratricopeptide repeat protein [candidate division KSB1 bacterium]MDZ7299683.1 tetratricopeptide repeat protein [candidate division KSB1 bacterium]MDZ7307947.1 tetratricopeptide repeat protein [candidate division KSB1 bacterium]